MAREAVYIRIILEEMGHKHFPTPLQTDNSMAEAVVNGKIQPKQTKAMDMGFHWLRDRECQDQFRIYWRPGNPTMQIIGQSIILQNTIETLENNFSRRTLY